MIRAREIRIALTGALLFIVAGTLQACASDAIAGPEEQPPVMQANTGDGDDNCIWVGGVQICQ